MYVLCVEEQGCPRNLRNWKPLKTEHKLYEEWERIFTGDEKEPFFLPMQLTCYRYTRRRLSLLAERQKPVANVSVRMLGQQLWCSGQRPRSQSLRMVYGHGTNLFIRTLQVCPREQSWLNFNKTFSDHFSIPEPVQKVFERHYHYAVIKHLRNRGPAYKDVR